MHMILACDDGLELRTVSATLLCVMVSLSSVNVSFLFGDVRSFNLMTFLYGLY